MEVGRADSATWSRGPKFSPTWGTWEGRFKVSEEVGPREQGVCRWTKTRMGGRHSGAFRGKDLSKPETDPIPQVETPHPRQKRPAQVAVTAASVQLTAQLALWLSLGRNSSQPDTLPFPDTV